MELSPIKLDPKSVIAFAVSAVLIGVGSLLASAYLLYLFDIALLNIKTKWLWEALGAALTLLLGIISGMVGYHYLPRMPSASIDKTSPQWGEFQRFQFGAHLCFLGYFLFLMGLCCLVVLVNLLDKEKLMVSGIFQSHKFSMVVTEFQGSLDDERALKQAKVSTDVEVKYQVLAEQVRKRKAALRGKVQEAKLQLIVLLVLSCGLSVFGSMFFTINTLKEKRSAKNPEFFDRRRFWGELVFRCGEAILFTIVLFWLIWNSQSPHYYTWLPVMALFLGMFIKSAEQVIYGLSDKVLEKLRLLLPFEAPVPVSNGENIKKDEPATISIPSPNQGGSTTTTVPSTAAPPAP